MVAKVLPNFGLPWTDTIVARCYGAIDVAIKNCISRIQTYFLMEGNGFPQFPALTEEIREIATAMIDY